MRSKIRVARFKSGSNSTARLSIKDGTDAQIANVNSTLPHKLGAIVLSESGEHATGVEVQFQVAEPVPGEGASVTPTSSQSTLPNGAAETTLTLGSKPIEYKVTATCPTCAASGASVTFRVRRSQFFGQLWA